MGTNIYDIREWKSGTAYVVDDIIWYTATVNGIERRYYWYATVDHTASTVPSLSNSQWMGIKYDNRAGGNKPFWGWKPSYNFSVDSSPRVTTHKFGDGYEARLVDGIESILLKSNMTFETRSAKESRAMTHFLSARKGQESFLLMLPPPYNIEKLYVARDWTLNHNFYDNNTIRMSIEEVTS